MARKYSATQLKAKELGIPKWHVLGNDKLKSAIALKENPTETASTGETDEQEGLGTTSGKGLGVNKRNIPKEVEAPLMKMKLPYCLTLDILRRAIERDGEKSPYWEYRGLLNGD